MRTANIRIIFFVALASIYFIACKKTDETPILSYKQFVNPKVGKFIIYQLDSTVTVNFGSAFVKRSYLIKDSIVEKFVDNQNRESYKLFRYQYDAVTKTWNPTNTFFLTPTDTKLEYVENNQRYIRLVEPISDFKSWQGNTNISIQMYNPGNFFNTWTFYYKDVNQPAQVGMFNFAKTVSVVQYDSTENTPFFPNNYNQYNKSYEIYADTIGLVYKDILSWEYQAFTNISNCKLIKPKTGGGFDTSFVNCNLAATNCDSLRQLPNYKIMCDTSLTQFFYTGYGTTQKILSHN